MHSTNYRDTLIAVAPDTRATAAVPPPRGRGTVAELQFELLDGHDYELTSDDVVFEVYRRRGGTDDRESFFGRGQPCLRTSPLAKTYGWGIHSDAQGRVALVPQGSPRYRDLLASPDVATVAAMRTTRPR